MYKCLTDKGAKPVYTLLFIIYNLNKAKCSTAEKLLLLAAVAGLRQ